MGTESDGQSSGRVRATKFLCCAKRAAKQILEWYFHGSIEFEDWDAQYHTLKDAFLHDSSDTLNNWKDWPIKENREVFLEASVIKTGSSSVQKVTLRVLVVKFDHQKMPYWVPVFARFWHKAKNYCVEKGFNFERKKLPSGRFATSPREIEYWGDAKDD